MTTDAVLAVIVIVLISACFLAIFICFVKELWKRNRNTLSNEEIARILSDV